MGQVRSTGIGLNRAAGLAAMLSFAALAVVLLAGRSIMAAVLTVPAGAVVLLVERHLNRRNDGEVRADALVQSLRLGALVGIATWTLLAVCAVLLIALDVPGADDARPVSIEAVVVSAVTTTAAAAMFGGIILVLHVLLGNGARQRPLPSAILMALAVVCNFAIFLMPQHSTPMPTVGNEAYSIK